MSAVYRLVVELPEASFDQAVLVKFRVQGLLVEIGEPYSVRLETEEKDG